MSKSSCVSLLVMIASSFLIVQAQGTSASAEISERSRLVQEREAIESRYNLQEVACYKKFAVSSCLKQVKTEKTAVLIDIKRKELALNDLQREDRKVRINSKKENSTLTNAKKTEAVISKPNKSIDLNEKQRENEAASRVDEANRKLRISQAKAVQRAEKNKLATEQATKYQKKLIEAQEHKVALEQKNANSTKPKSTPLPVPVSKPNTD